jgi:hypothetical protein
MRLPRRVLTPAFIEAWRAYQAANARAADMYEAIPVAHRRDGSAIPRCDCGTVALSGLCRVCRKEKS